MNFKPTPSQQKALEAIEDFIRKPIGNSFNDRVLVLTGQAGTGKTTILRYALSRLLRQDLENAAYNEDDFFSDFGLKIPNVMGVTISHKAKLRLQESVPNACTYAAFFGLKPVYMHDGSMRFEKQDRSKNPNAKPLPHEIPFLAVVHDEVSMYDMHYINTVEMYTHSNSKIIFVGDPNQLPPISDDSKSTDLDSPAFMFFDKVVRLEERVRQTVGNPILDIADAIHKEIFEEKNLSKILELIKQDRFKDGVGYRTISPQSLIGDYVDTYKRNDDTRVICYRNKKIDLINNRIRKKLFPGIDESFTVGDALYMNLTYVNNDEHAFFNSEEFKISSIDKSVISGVECYRAFVKPFEGGSIYLVSEKGQSEFKKKLKTFKDAAINAEFKYKSLKWEHYYKFRDLFADVSYGYAFTAYKAQGSGFKNVYVDVSDILSTPISDKRKLQTLYTAVTRATHQVIFF